MTTGFGLVTQATSRCSAISGEYVEYGKIIDAYYSKMFGKVQDGNYTEEEKKAMAQDVAVQKAIDFVVEAAVEK